MIIEYTELGRTSLPHGGYRIVGRFKDADPSGNYDQTRAFYVDSDYPSDADVEGRVDDLTTEIHYEVNPLNYFDLGSGEERPVIITIVGYVRPHPDATEEEIIAEIEDEHPNILWKADKFLTEMHDYLEQEMGRSYTFAEFKQFLIDEKFVGVD
ncbi:MAG: hypothetical protein U9Q37_04605 [Euryarchaeota archaeon]|nr:hypothetical protein [Euryarchaeota archaeon]